MTLQVLQIVDSMKPEAGSEAISLQGLFEALRSHEVASDILEIDGHQSDDPASTQQRIKKADLVHFHGWGDRFARNMASMAHAASTPYLIAPHGALSPRRSTSGGWRKKLFSSWSGRRFVRRAKALVAMNAVEYESLCSKPLHDNVVTLSHGLNTGDYESGDPVQSCNLPDAPEGRLILMLAPMHPVEGVAPLLLSLAELGPLADSWSVVVAGPQQGQWRKMLEAVIRRRGGEDRVLFTKTGDVDTQKAWLRRASLLVAPRLEIGMGTSVLQAVACGVPVIVSKMVAPPAIAEAITVYGFARHELKKALRKCFELSDEERRNLADRAKTALKQRADWSVLVDDYVNLYRDGTGTR